MPIVARPSATCWTFWRSPWRSECVATLRYELTHARTHTCTQIKSFVALWGKVVQGGGLEATGCARRTPPHPYPPSTPLHPLTSDSNRLLRVVLGEDTSVHRLGYFPDEHAVL
ncbi:hypothetical protein AVEN_259232-1 [Araneus ventricosus]|uniref:Uncharacterized protein n=1 Tax=Araneus ventricosus TaxID=182803 RepID=A0A4Y2IIE3_ARAVE|nr:hypothetical protein AVEN_259232-1 [Araneus ventricosus]